jgi:DNA-binding response OmpR family regulator
MEQKILIIDDDKELCALIKKYGEQANYLIHVAYSGSQGLKKAEENEYQLIILDVMLPEINGFSVLSEIRKDNPTPVLMLTAKDSEDDKIKGLSIGADDYLTKPFSMNELMARTHSLIRRYTLLNNNTPDIIQPIQLQGMIINAENRTVLQNEKNIDLSAKEFDLLYFLAINNGKIFTKRQLYLQVWKEDYAFDDSNIMSFISKLRKKIESDPTQPFYIQTIRGIGYRFNQGAAL